MSVARLYAPPGVKQPPCYSPQACQVAYGVAPLLGRGIDGSGETVVVGPEPAASPPSMDIRQDLAAFGSKFGLPPAKLQVVNTIARSATPISRATRKSRTPRWCTRSRLAPTLDVVLVPQDAIASSLHVITTRVVVQLSSRLYPSAQVMALPRAR